ncbi:unnamed protein product [Gongylonema pulchrum]|uniref:Cadherin domain-containing protein n=1 Tax=Gongylonema pulchrum TaxID=637853 RepID=A0A183ECA3_9BILA|nr:unnamed protein product [Gongylonema pulchrum]
MGQYLSYRCDEMRYGCTVLQVDISSGEYVLSASKETDGPDEFKLNGTGAETVRNGSASDWSKKLLDGGPFEAEKSSANTWILSGSRDSFSAERELPSEADNDNGSASDWSKKLLDGEPFEAEKSSANTWILSGSRDSFSAERELPSEADNDVSKLFS